MGQEDSSHRENDNRGNDAARNVQRWQLLVHQSPTFRNTPEAFVRRIVAHMVERKLEDGETLFLKHDPEDFIALVVEGCIYTVLYGPNGRELIVDGMGPGQLVGETALIAPKMRNATAFASGPTRILQLGHRHFAELTAELAFVDRFLLLLCSRLRHSVDLVESVGLYRLESRLARYLLSILDDHGRTEEGGIVVPLPPNQSVLAAMINASRPKLNAQLQTWRRTGLIRWQHDTLKITDIDQLRRKANIGS